MTIARIDIGRIRREQIVAAAVTVIAEQGIQNLSLSEIEKKVGMSRGQLTYYFKTKEDILLAVFDRLVFLMHQHQGDEKDGAPACWEQMNWLDLVGLVLQKVLSQPPSIPEFHALQYTFLSQISHRADYRERLARLYEDWRTRMVGHIERDLRTRSPVRAVDLRTLATLVQSIFHGLAIQMAADPESIQSDAVVKLTLDLLSTYLWGSSPAGVEKSERKATRTPQKTQ